MKKTLLSLLTILTLSLPLGISGQASAGIAIVPQCSGGTLSGGQSNSFCSDVTGAKKGAKSDPVIKIIKDVTIVISWIAGIAAVILIIISAIRFMTSGGDSAQVASARGALISAIVGIVITLLAQLIVVFVLDKVNS